MFTLLAFYQSGLALFNAITRIDGLVSAIMSIMMNNYMIQF